MTANFCSSCGTQLPQAASFCSGCGAKVGAQPTIQQSPIVPPQNYSTPHRHTGRTKTTAVLLALFFGPFSYFYTPKTDSIRFSMTFGVCFFIFIAGFGMLASNDAQPQGFVAILLGGFICNVIPLLTMAMRTQAYYDDYDRTHGSSQ